MGPSDLGGIMQKRIISAILLALVLSGCAPSGKEIILTDAADTASVTDVAASDEVFAQSSKEPSADAPAPLEEVHKEIETIFIYVCGAVEKPGVYELPEDSRIVDAVDACGGFSDDADETYVNLAAKLDDGIKLYIPTIEETREQQASTQIDTFDKGESSFDGGSDSSNSGLININRATKEELTLLPGIGNSTAEKIISYREQHGSFKSIEDIMNVSGIKDKLFSKIKDHITV